MDVLAHLGVSSDVSKEDFLMHLSTLPALVYMRENVFKTAVVSGLADSGDVFVGRRKGRGEEKSV